MSELREKVQGTSKSGWCLTRQHGECRYPKCSCHCHEGRPS